MTFARQLAALTLAAIISPVPGSAQELRPAPAPQPGSASQPLTIDQALARAHVATQIPGDIAGLAASHPERLAGIVLCAPVRLDRAPFAGLGEPQR